MTRRAVRQAMPIQRCKRNVSQVEVAVLKTMHVINELAENDAVLRPNILDNRRTFIYIGSQPGVV